MSTEKSSQLEVKSYNEDQESSETENTRTISFDLYFQLLMKKSPKIYAHHKAPMEKYAGTKGLIEATEDQFDRIFKDY